MTLEPAIGIIGGSGLYDIEGIENKKEVRVETPFGDPSGVLRVGEINGRKVVFIARHGEGHWVDPTHIPYRANIHALKQMGVRKIFSVSAVGSMKEEIEAGDMVAIDQFIDRTRHRADSFYGDGCVAHIAFSDPICPGLQKKLVSSSKAMELRVHDGGTYVCMEGPAFSTRAESLMYRTFGVSVIGMTNLTEAKLAREAEICYATLALATDYDCWHEGEEDVTVEGVVATLKRNVANAKRILAHALANTDASKDCFCNHSLEGAIMTAPGAISPESREKLALLLERSMSL